MRILDAVAALDVRLGDYEAGERTVSDAIELAEALGDSVEAVGEMKARRLYYRRDQPWTSTEGS